MAPAKFDRLRYRYCASRTWRRGLLRYVCTRAYTRDTCRYWKRCDIGKILTSLAVWVPSIKKRSRKKEEFPTINKSTDTNNIADVPLPSREAAPKNLALRRRGQRFSFFLRRSRSNNLINFHYGYCDAIILVSLRLSLSRSLWQSTLVELIVKRVSLPYLLLLLLLFLSSTTTLLASVLSLLSSLGCTRFCFLCLRVFFFFFFTVPCLVARRISGEI